MVNFRCVLKEENNFEKGISNEILAGKKIRSDVWVAQLETLNPRVMINTTTVLYSLEGIHIEFIAFFSLLFVALVLITAKRDCLQRTNESSANTCERMEPITLSCFLMFINRIRILRKRSSRESPCHSVHFDRFYRSNYLFDLGLSFRTIY